MPSDEQGTLFDVPADWFLPPKRCPVCGVAVSIQHEYTYIVQRQWWVKIGATDRPRKRINELSRWDWKNYCLWPEGMDWDEPLIVHGMVGGDFEHESHVRFQKQWVIGEWFIPDDEMREWIREVTQ